MRNTILFFIQWCCAEVFGQTIDISFTKFNVTGTSESRLQMRCHVVNNDTLPMTILFSEDNLNCYDQRIGIIRKICRKYKDFSLSMLAWESDMIVDGDLATFPDLFVKILNPKDTFDIIVDSEENSEDAIRNCLLSHLLICDQSTLSAPNIGLSHFIECIQDYNFNYSYSFISINYTDFLKFVDNNQRTHQ